MLRQLADCKEMERNLGSPPRIASGLALKLHADFASFALAHGCLTVRCEARLIILQTFTRLHLFHLPVSQQTPLLLHDNLAQIGAPRLKFQAERRWIECRVVGDTAREDRECRTSK